MTKGGRSDLSREVEMAEISTATESDQTQEANKGSEKQPKKKSKTVLIVSIAIIVAFSLWGIIFPDNLSTTINAVNEFLCVELGWSYLWLMFFFLVFGFAIALSKYGKLKMGKPEDKPEFSNLQWFALLFGGGIGIGLVFWCVAEPVMHYYSGADYDASPIGEPYTYDAMIAGIRIAFMHEGVHCWATFGLVGMCLGYAAYSKGLPFTISSTLYPLIGDRINGWMGKLVDIIATFATVFGIATSLGLGALQIAGGLGYVYGIPESPMMTALIIGIITAVFTLATVTGLHKLMSTVVNFKAWLSVFFMVFLLVFAGTVFILDNTSMVFGEYISKFVYQSFWYEDPVWLTSWTVFYWAWWISWATFCGQFFARVSRGRTVRQMFLGGTLVPAGFSFIWICIFASAGFFVNDASIAANGGLGTIVEATQENYTYALFAMLDELPIYEVMAPLALILILICFVGAADSATFVLPMITMGGELNPSKLSRAGWGIAQGVVTIVLILASGEATLRALQTASVVAALPYMIVMVLMCVALLRMLKKDYNGEDDSVCALDEYLAKRARKKELGAGGSVASEH